MPSSRFERLLFHLIDELAVYDDNPINAERDAVHLFAQIHRRMEVPDD